MLDKKGNEKAGSLSSAGPFAVQLTFFLAIVTGGETLDLSIYILALPNSQ